VTGGGDGDGSSAQALVTHYVDLHPRQRPSGQLIGQVGKAAKQLLADGFDPAVIRQALDEIVRRGRPVSALPHLATEIANRRPARVEEPWNPSLPPEPDDEPWNPSLPAPPRRSR
jgi:hypothetical protein